VQALGPLPPITAEPRDGNVVNAGLLLEEIDRRLLQHRRHPDDLKAQAALADVHHLLGLVRYSLLDPNGASAGRHRMEQHSSRFVQLRAREADAAVELALADLRRGRGQ